jgi:hypothetical protein
VASPRSGLADDPRDRVATALFAGAYRLGDVACLMVAIKAAGLTVPARWRAGGEENNGGDRRQPEGR